ncbi:MAG: peptide chain release factor 1 [Myxococcota bacterium]
MFERLEEVVTRVRELEASLADPATAVDPARLREVGRELSAIRPKAEAYLRWKTVREALEENAGLLQDPDPEIRELASAEIASLEREREQLEERLRRELVPSDPSDVRNVVLEIRAGAGGEEAALFAADLFRMYSRFAVERGFDVETLSMSETPGGGLKELIAEIRGPGAFGLLKQESGVHRVQRVPVTESQGRIHTSTVTVAILPEAEDVEVKIDEARDLRVDVYRSSGPGGQSVNTTDSAVRITHLPTGEVVTCQDEKSQHKNKARALKILRSRLFDRERRRAAEERAEERRGQIGSGERSERIRTYNFPQNRITDHRVNLTLHKLDRVLEGELGELIEGVRQALEAEASA